MAKNREIRNALEMFLVEVWERLESSLKPFTYWKIL